MSVLTTTPLKVAPAAAAALTVTTGTFHAYGAWVQLIASTAAPIAVAGVAGVPSISAQAFDLDIGVGAASAEVSVGTLRIYAQTPAAIGDGGLILPVPLGGIGSGVRVALRGRTLADNAANSAALTLLYYENLSSDQVTTSSQVLSAAPSSVDTVTLTPSATPWANSAWVELMASAASDIGLLGLVHSVPSATGAEDGIEFDLGTGAASAETVRTTLRQSQAVGRTVHTWLPGIYPVTAGTRIAVRMRKSGTTTTGIEVALLYYTNVSAAPPPTVETLAAAVLTYAQSRLRGRINPNGTAITGFFRWGLGPEALVNETTPEALGSGTAAVSYAVLLTTLTAATTYYFQAVGETGSETLGEILSFTTLGEHVFEDGRVSQPLTWMGFVDREEETHVFAEVDLNDRADYYYGYKAPWVLAWNQITRGLSDRTGQLEHMAFGVVLSDTTRFFRDLLDNVTNRYLTNRPYFEYMIDDEQRRLEGLPRLVANGYISDYEPQSPLQFQITGCDWLKKKFSRKARAQRAWQPTITIEDFPDCPVATLSLAAPLIYGKVDDQTLEERTVPTFPINSSWPHVSMNASGDMAGGTLDGRVFVKIVGVKDGTEGPVVPYVGAGTIDYQRSVLAAWDPPLDGSPDFYDSYHIYFFGGNGLDVDWDDWNPGTGLRTIGTAANVKFVRRLSYDLSSSPSPDDDWGEAPWPPFRTYAVFLHSNTEGEDMLTGGSTMVSTVDVGHGTVKPIYVGTNIIDSVLYYKGLVSRGACQSIRELYIDGVPLNIATDSAQAGVGGIWLIPGYPGWEAYFSDPYEDINGRRYTVIWGRAGKPGPDRMAGVMSDTTGAEPGAFAVGVTLNVWGIEDVGDGSGDLITSLPMQQKHFMRNFLAPDSPPLTEWLTACETFVHEPTLTLIDEASFDTVEAIWEEANPEASPVGSPQSAGIEGAFIIGANGEFVTGLDVLAQFHVSGDWDGTFTSKGQYMATMEPVSEPIGSPELLELDDILNVVRDSFSIRDQVSSEFFNILPYVHTRDYTGVTEKGWFSLEAGETDVRDAASITNYEQERESAVFELAMLSNRTALGAAAIELSMARKLNRYRHPLRTAMATFPLAATQLEIGDIFRLSHVEGIGPSGWVGRLVRVMRFSLDPNQNRVKLELYDVEPLLS